ncbi:hypothetical protein COY87_03970, partial [Candidatus Roizmanbacteria bacterium CG_4_10_14_0_8_um_filter_33_9]
MTEPRSGITPVEALRNTERIFMGESRCEVPEGSKDIATAFGKAEPGKTFDPLKSLVITDIPIGIDGNPIRTEQQIKDLSSKVQKLVEEGKISGLYLNCLSKSGQEGIAAKMSIIFLEIFVNKLEDGKSVTEAIADLIELGKNDTQSEEIDGFSAVVVKDGKAHVVGLEDKVAVKIIKADGSVDIQKSGDEIGLEKDSKIVLCSKDDARLDSVKGLSVEQIVEELNKPPVSEKEKKQVTVEKKYNSPNGVGAYDDRFFICESTGFVGVIDGASGIGGGGKNAADTAWIVLATETGGDTLQFDGKKREEVEESLRKIAERANREIRIHTRTSGKAVCLSTGEIYQDADGKLSFSYINHGDTEIAIVKKDGSVQLVPNHSIRHLSETDPRGINLYLSEREASFKLMEGQNTRELDQKIIVGSIDIDEGDKVIFLTDGVAEDLHNIRGSVSSDGTISPQKGSDGKQIGLDILSQVKDLDAKSASSKIMDLLAEVRAIPEDKGVIVTRHSNINNSEVRRKIVQKDGLNIVVGGKGPKTDKGYDDGETVVVMEAKMTKEKVLGQAHGVAVGEVKSETVQQAAQQIEPTPQPASDLAGWEQANQIRAALEASGEKEAKKVEEQFIKAKAVAILAEPHNDQTRGEEALKKVLQRITDTGKSPDFYNLPGVGEFLRSSLEKDALTKNDSDIFDRTRNKIAYNLDSPQGVQGALDYLKAICVDPSDGRDIASKEQLIDFYTDRVIEKIEHRIKFNKDRTSIATDQDQPLHRLAQLAGVQRLVDEGKLDDAFFADVKKMRVEKQQKAAVHAEVKPPGPVPAPERAKKEGVFEAVDDGSETVSLTKITDPKHEATYQFDRINKSVLDAKFFSDTAQSNLPPELKRDPNETPTAYKKRILTAIQSRLAQAPADPSKDSLYTMLITGTKPDPRLLAQVVEADLLLIQQQERKEQIKVLKASFPENPHLMGREVHQRGLRDAVEDVSLDYFAHKGEVDAQGRELFVAPEAKLDILAFRLVSNSMLDVVDHGIASVFSHPDQAPVKAVVDGIITDYAKAHNNKYPSYRELLNALRSRIDAQSKGESKDDQGRFISRVAEARIRGIFYDNVYTMLENSRNYDATSQTVLNRTDLPQPVMDMLKQLNIEICDNGWVDSHKIPQLIQKYTQLRAG